jgi:hypothetical protein
MRLITLSLILLSGINLHAQCSGATNLIPNPSFETTNASCTGTDNQLYSNQSPVNSWFGTEAYSGTAGSTPDYLNNNASACGVDMSLMGQATCFVRNRSLGVFVYTPSVNGREYIQAALNSSLLAGQTYCFSMRVRTNTTMGNNTDGIGAHFRNSGVINIATMNGGNQFLGAGSTLNMVPQVQQTSGSQIGASCTIVTGTFVASGGENRVIIGNFRTNAATSASNTSAPSYMLIDDVRLFLVSPLPVQLLNFHTNCFEGIVSVNWTTEYERNNAYFSIEQSCDGFNYEPIATINGNGNSEISSSYSVDVEASCDGVNYFRLLQTDTDGTTTILSETSLNCNATEAQLYYNSSTNQIVLNEGKKQTTSLKVYDVNGRLIKDLTNYLEHQSEKQQIELTHMSAGVYQIVLEELGGTIKHLPIYISTR